MKPAGKYIAKKRVEQTVIDLLKDSHAWLWMYGCLSMACVDAK